MANSEVRQCCDVDWFTQNGGKVTKEGITILLTNLQNSKNVHTQCYERSIGFGECLSKTVSMKKNLDFFAPHPAIYKNEQATWDITGFIVDPHPLSVIKII